MPFKIWKGPPPWLISIGLVNCVKHPPIFYTKKKYNKTKCMVCLVWIGLFNQRFKYLSRLITLFWSSESSFPETMQMQSAKPPKRHWVQQSVLTKTRALQDIWCDMKPLSWVSDRAGSQEGSRNFIGDTWMIVLCTARVINTKESKETGPSVWFCQMLINHNQSKTED